VARRERDLGGDGVYEADRFPFVATGVQASPGGCRGVELQTAMTLSGAADAKTHRRYLTSIAKARQVPDAALPKPSIRHAQLVEAEPENLNDFSGRDRA
jgi:hypothetical protein